MERYSSQKWPQASDAKETCMADGILKDLASVVMGVFNRRREVEQDAARRRQASHALAAILGGVLDRYADSCLAVARDDGTAEGLPASKDRTQHEATVQRPTFDPNEHQVDLNALPPEVMYAILHLPSRAAEIDAALVDDGFYDPPDHAQYFYARQHGYAELGHRAAQLAQRLRQIAGVPEPALAADELSREATLRKRFEQLEDQQNARNKRARTRVRSRAEVDDA